MLSLEQIIELQEKGFTYEQLQVLNTMNVTTPEVIIDPAPMDEAKPENAINEAKQEPPENDVITGLKNELTELTNTIKAMQEQNVKNAKAEPKNVETAEDIIKSFMGAS